MQVLNPNDVKIYNLTHGRTIPDWLSERKKRLLLKTDVSLRKRIQLIQEFEMPISSQRVALTPDKTHIYATGVYPPRVRCFDTRQLSMKFERGMDSEVVAFHILSDDWKKLVLLQSERYVELQTQDGIYYRTRIPTFGRDLAYYPRTAELFIGATGPRVFRLNLCKGTFMNPLETLSTGVNVTKVHPQHSLLFLGTESGTVECWDPRSRAHCATLSLPNKTEVTALQTNGLLGLAVGTARGLVYLYDIRSPAPLLTKDHHYEQPINSIFYGPDELLMTACSRSFKLWNGRTGAPFTAIESEEDICQVAWHEGTGMFFFAKEAQRLGTFYIPAVGPAPRWCSFMDSVTEELEESTENVVYEDYKFLTSEELEELGLAHLAGSSYLRPYMHGFFISMKLWREAREIVQPFAFQEYREKKLAEKLAVPDRVERRRVLPKVNKNLATRDLHRGGKLLEDDRFGSLFTDPDYQVDEESERFKLVNPTVRKHDQSDFSKYEEQEEEEEEEEEEEQVVKSRGKRAVQMKLVSCENESKIFAQNTSSVSLPLGSRVTESEKPVSTSEGNVPPRRESKFRGDNSKDDGRERRQLGRSAAPFLKRQRGKFWRGRKVG